MINVRELFAPFNGRTFVSFRELRPFLEVQRKAHLQSLPPDLSLEEILMIGRRHALVREDDNGHLRICTDTQETR